MLYKEYGWNGLACPHCTGLIPRPDGDIGQCLDCEQYTSVTSLLKVSSNNNIILTLYIAN